MADFGVLATVGSGQRGVAEQAGWLRVHPQFFLVCSAVLPAGYILRVEGASMFYATTAP